ncbi:MAG: hypothetical protein M5U26_14325 [Planctomycetota bacterium]|nr:hypothetical protein [Planctomycetota bacterium]
MERAEGIVSTEQFRDALIERLQVTAREPRLGILTDFTSGKLDTRGLEMRALGHMLTGMPERFQARRWAVAAREGTFTYGMFRMLAAYTANSRIPLALFDDAESAIARLTEFSSENGRA